MPTLNDFFSGVRWLLVENVSGVEIPAFAVLRVSGVTATGLYQVTKPNEDSQGGCLINSPTTIPAPTAGVNATGQATDEVPWFALYDAADGTPANGESWGAGAASWKLRKDKTGYLIYGDVTAGRVVVTRAGGAGAGVCTPIITDIDFDLCTYTIRYAYVISISDTPCA